MLARFFNDYEEIKDSTNKNKQNSKKDSGIIDISSPAATISVPAPRNDNRDVVMQCDQNKFVSVDDEIDNDEDGGVKLTADDEIGDVSAVGEQMEE